MNEPATTKTLQDYLDFLIQVFQKVAENPNSQLIYPFWEQNLNKLNDNLVPTLNKWAREILTQVTPEQAYIFVGVIFNLSTLIQEFPFGNIPDNKEIAISGYKIALKIFSFDKFPQDWAMTQSHLAAAYSDRIRGDKAENLEMAIAYYQEALKVYTFEIFPQKWAMIRNNLANAYSDRIRGDKAKNLEIAISYYQEALKVRTFEAFPIDWAITQNNLAATYSDRIRGDKAENLERAIFYYQEALKVRTFEAFPIDWAMTQYNLAIAYSDRIRGDKAENLERAIFYYQEALKVRTFKTFPIDWAMTQNNLGNTYRNRIRGDKAENLELAIAYYQEALKVRTVEQFPHDWAITQNNLAITYYSRIKGNKAENLELAIAYCQEILEVLTFEAFPIDWAMAQNNLAAAYPDQISEDKSENLEMTIECYQEALKVYTFEAFPIDWAMTQNNLGNAYVNRTKGDKAENLDIAISYYKEALKVRTVESFPIDWVTTQNNLAIAYCKRSRGDKAENLKMAIASFDRALRIRTKENNPLNCLLIARNLGILHYREKQWQPATKAYHLAIKAVETSRLEGLNPQRRQEIISNAIEVYHRIVQSYLKCDRADKALEYVERSKTRNLVELLANQEIYPQGIPETIKEEFDRLRRAVVGEQQKLALEEQNQNSRSQMLTSSQREQPFLVDHTHFNQLQQQLHEFIEREITPIDPDFILTQEVTSISLNEIQSLTDEKTAILEWYITGDKILVFIITADNLKVWQSSTEDVNNLINCSNEYIEKYYQQKNEWLENLTLYLNNLSKILHLDEVLKLVNQKCDRLILIPHRFLHLFPLHALPLDESEGDLLSDRFDRGISYAPSCQLLKVVQNKQRLEFDRLFAIQNPTQDLIYTELEVEIIRSFFPETEVLAKHNASEANLKVHQDFPFANCLHFSCHGTFNPNSPLESALLLNEDEANQEDGKLTLGEIFELSLNHCRLVTLSACETGLTDINSLSDEYIGLPSGFLYAGSPSIVSSLWTVSDLSTTFLMIEFYKNLIQQGEPVAIALKKAQNWLRNLTVDEFDILIEQFKPQLDRIYSQLPMGLRIISQESIKQIRQCTPHPFANPYYWAAFTAIGF
jgi:CHAT domain-containing protein